MAHYNYLLNCRLRCLVPSGFCLERLAAPASNLADEFGRVPFLEQLNPEKTQNGPYKNTFKNCVTYRPPCILAIGVLKKFRFQTYFLKNVVNFTNFFLRNTWDSVRIIFVSSRDVPLSSSSS